MNTESYVMNTESYVMNTESYVMNTESYVVDTESYVPVLRPVQVRGLRGRARLTVGALEGLVAVAGRRVPARRLQHRTLVPLVERRHRHPVRHATRRRVERVAPLQVVGVAVRAVQRRGGVARDR